MRKLRHRAPYTNFKIYINRYLILIISIIMIYNLAIYENNANMEKVRIIVNTAACFSRKPFSASIRRHACRFASLQSRNALAISV